MTRRPLIPLLRGIITWFLVFDLVFFMGSLSVRMVLGVLSLTGLWFSEVAR